MIFILYSFFILYKSLVIFIGRKIRQVLFSSPIMGALCLSMGRGEGASLENPGIESRLSNVSARNISKLSTRVRRRTIGDCREKARFRGRSNTTLIKIVSPTYGARIAKR